MGSVIDTTERMVKGVMIWSEDKHGLERIELAALIADWQHWNYKFIFVNFPRGVLAFVLHWCMHLIPRVPQ
jgi:hypothetical protein